MKGSIVTRISKNGRKLYYAVVFLGHSPEGKKLYKWIAASGKGDAQEKVNSAVYRVNHGDHNPVDSKIKLSDFMVSWLNDERHRLSPRTVELYGSIIRQSLTPALGKLRLKDVKSEMIQRFYSTKLDAGKSTTTVRNHARLLHKILADALSRGLLLRNPADAVKAPKSQETKAKTLSEPELELMLEAAMDTPYFPLFHLDAFTGMRQSELLALRWADIDLFRASVSVSRGVHHLITGEFVYWEPKAKSSRAVSLDEVTIMVLRRHLDAEMLQCTELKIPFNNDRLVFCKWDGQPLIGHSVSQAFQRLTERLGIKGVHFHCLRHTHATLLLQQGYSPKIIQERLGHKHIGTTMDIYSHVTPGMQKEAAEGFGRRFGAKIRERLDEISASKKND